MISFIPPRRKLYELLSGLLLAAAFYGLVRTPEAASLFVFGFIWNWSTTIDIGPIFEHRRFRFSMLKTVVNIQNLFLKPFKKAPEVVQRIVATFPAGIFWWMVVYINESEMPWWSTFVGSFCYEICRAIPDYFWKKASP